MKTTRHVQNVFMFFNLTPVNYILIWKTECSTVYCYYDSRRIIYVGFYFVKKY